MSAISRRLRCLPLNRLLLSSALLALPISLLAQTTPPPAPTSRTCPIDQSTPTDGERALAREDYDAALTFYRAALVKEPRSLEAHLGLVRALIGKDQTGEAIKEAQAAMTQSPHNAIAEVAAGEAAYRNADFEGARNFAKIALTDDPCQPQALALIAQLSDIVAFFAMESQNYDVQFTGVSGKVKKVYVVDNAALQFGHFGLPPSSYFAFDLTNISHDSGIEVSGMIGLPTLSRLTITVDYRDNLIDLKYDPKHDRQRF